jgi:hypothetical protein
VVVGDRGTRKNHGRPGACTQHATPRRGADAPDVFCEARFAGLSPWFAPVRGGGGGVCCGLVRHALCIFEPRSTPNELGLIAVTLFSEGRVAVWPLAVAAEELQHAIHRCLGSRAALQASPGTWNPLLRPRSPIVSARVTGQGDCLQGVQGGRSPPKW